MTTKKPTASNIVLPSSWDLIRPSLQLIKQNIDTMLWLVVIPGVLSVLSGTLINRIVANHTAALGDTPTTTETARAVEAITHDVLTTTQGMAALAILAVTLLWTILVFPATVEFTVRAVQGKPADVFTCLSEGFHKFWRIYAVTILITIIIGFGLLLFVVPGLLLMQRYLLAPYYLADRDLSIRDSIRTAAAESAQHKWYVLGTFGVFFVLSLVSSACNALPGVGLILGPLIGYIYYFGFALRYKTITEAQKALTPAEK